MNDPIHIISLGAGRQSSRMALGAARGEFGQVPSCAIFADTQDEPEAVYEWLDKLEKWLPFPVHRVTAGKLSESALDLRTSAKSGNTYLKTGLPVFYKNGTIGIGRRQCTSEFKIRPIRDFVQKIRDGCDVVMWIGISRDEAHRMKPARDSWQTHIWPLVDRGITANDCQKWLLNEGYGLAPRSACDYCPYHSDNEWRRLRDNHPASFARSIALEKRLQKQAELATAIRGVPFFHRSCVPLDQVDFSTDEDHGQQVMFGNECEGMCGV